MFRTLVTAAALGLAAVTAVPASAAVTLYCFSADVQCQGFQCPPDAHAIYDNGFPDTGPWLVICAPN